MWIGTANGLYLLEKATDKYQYIPMPVESSYIYSLYQAPNGLLYIGTNNSGLLIYDPEKNKGCNPTISMPTQERSARMGMPYSAAPTAP